MKYTIRHIQKAFELANIPPDFAQNVINYLPEAVEQTRLIEPDNLEDLFEWFCFGENVSESLLRSKKRDRYLIELRIMFTILAKQRFGKQASQPKIGRVLNRDHATILHYQRIVRTRELKAEKMNKIKNGL